MSIRRWILFLAITSLLHSSRAYSNDDLLVADKIEGLEFSSGYPRCEQGKIKVQGTFERSDWKLIEISPNESLILKNNKFSFEIKSVQNTAEKIEFYAISPYGLYERETLIVNCEKTNNPPINTMGLQSLEVSLEDSFFKIDALDRATNAAATLASSTNLGGTIKWAFNFSKQGSLDLSLHTVSSNITQPSNRVITPLSQQTSDFGFGWSYRLLPKATLEVRLQDGQQLFVKGISTSSITLDRLFILQSLVKIRGDLFQSESYGLSAAVGWGHLFNRESSDGEDFLGGTHYSTEVYFSRQIQNNDQRHLSLLTSIFFDSQTQDTSIAEQTRKDIGFSIGFSYSR